ncbi:nucleoside phosphatase family-domain-containing protein [Geranomyces variabilis]|nr:nucleoside phosphatase family-domain-containing protein [Geranomyces variabilis]KAJ3132119.1 Guanosine-diphosphatase [Geranomyces variabilis]
MDMYKRRDSNALSYGKHSPLPHHTGAAHKRGLALPRGFGFVAKVLAGLLVVALCAYWTLQEPGSSRSPSRVIEAVLGSGAAEFKSTKDCPNPHPDRPALQYGLMIDAGSTGSRIHIYRFNHCHGPSPSLENEVFEQLKPGLSSPTFNTPEEAANSLDPLLQLALKHVPEDSRKCTPVSVKATAGLRMLKDHKGEKILDAVRHKLQTEYPFALVEPKGVEIMPGKDEGVYAWITVNYLLERIGQEKRLPTAAIMDLGGGSTQIVFEPHSSEPMEPGDHRYELSFGDHSYVLYQHSYDGYGLMQGRQRIRKAGVADKQFPCYALGHKETYTDDDKLVHNVEGTGGDHGVCHSFIQTHLFDKECPAPPHTGQKPSCSFDGVYQPSLTSSFANNDIYAFSYFYDKFAEPFGLVGPETGFKVGELRAAAEKVCAGKITAEELSTEAGAEAAKLFEDPEWCTDLGFMYGLLSVGYELPEDRILKTAKKIAGVETGWSLGAALNVVDGWGQAGKGMCVKETT